MPIYEFWCFECGTRHEELRFIRERDNPFTCPNGHDACQRVLSAPSLAIWDAARAFPNAVKSGPGTFPTKAAYETHLKANHIAEVKTDGKVYRPHGNRVISRF